MSEEMSITGFGLATDFASQIGPQSGGYEDCGIYKSHRISGEGYSAEEAATNFFIDLQSKGIDFTKPFIWRTLPEMLEDKDIPTQTIKYLFRARVAVKVSD